MTDTKRYNQQNEWEQTQIAWVDEEVSNEEFLLAYLRWFEYTKEDFLDAQRIPVIFLPAGTHEPDYKEWERIHDALPIP